MTSGTLAVSNLSFRLNDRSLFNYLTLTLNTDKHFRNIPQTFPSESSDSLFSYDARKTNTSTITDVRMNGVSRQLIDNFIPGTPRKYVYIRDCTWARPTMRACTELFISLRKREFGHFSLVPAFSSVCRSLSRGCLLCLLGPPLFPCTHRGGNSCIPQLPVFPRLFFPLLPVLADRATRRRRIE